MAKRVRVTLDIYQVVEIYPDALGYRIRCKLCGTSARWLHKDKALDEMADHLAAKHSAKGGKLSVPAASTDTPSPPC
jgi:hypothetical protein